MATVADLERQLSYHKDDDPIAYIFFTKSDIKSHFEEDTDTFGDDFEVTDEEAAQTLHNMMLNSDAEHGMNHNDIEPNAPQSLLDRANAARQKQNE